MRFHKKISSLAREMAAKSKDQSVSGNLEEIAFTCENISHIPFRIQGSSSVGLVPLCDPAYGIKCIIIFTGEGWISSF